MDQKQLKTLIARRHPQYDEMLPHWTFLIETYMGGRAWFANHLFKYIKEGLKEFNQRKKRSYRFNHTREVVDLVNKYVFRGTITRNTGDADQEVGRFWKKATLSGLNIDEFMEQVSQKSSIYGRVWIVVDNDATEQPETVADEKEMGVSVFSYIVKPQNVLDMGYDDKGGLLWVLIFEPRRDDQDPFASSGKLVDHYRLWTKEESFLYQVIKKGKEVTVAQVGYHEHGLGVVPVIKCDHVETEDKWSAPALIGDIAYLDRATANYLSNLDAIIQDQTFSQLAMPAQGLLPGEEGYDKLVQMSTNRMFTFDGEHGVVPFYLSPDPKQAQIIVEVINKIIGEIYHTVGLAGERTKQDNAVGIDNSSGVAKAFDFERVNTLLVSKANGLERTENKLVKLVRHWHSKEDSEQEDLVKYPEDYDIRSLYDEFDVAQRLSLIEAPLSVKKEQMKAVVNKLYPRIAKNLRERMLAEIDSWTEERDTSTQPSMIEPKEKRQGQVVAKEGDKKIGA